MAQTHNTIGSTIGRALGNAAAYTVHGAVSAAQYTGRFGQDVAAGATEQWIDRMKLENSKENGEPVLGPPIDAMLDRLGEVLPSHVSASLRILKEASWKPMNSFVHGGVHAILTGLVDVYTPYHWIGVLKNANGLATMNVQALVISCNDMNSRGLLAALQQRHLRCLPA